MDFSSAECPENSVERFEREMTREISQETVILDSRKTLLCLLLSSTLVFVGKGGGWGKIGWEGGRAVTGSRGRG